LTSKHRVNYHDKAEVLLDTIQKYTSSNSIAIYKGKPIDIKKTFIELSIPDKAKIMLIGVVELD